MNVHELKSNEQSKKFHAMCRDFARQIPVWCEMQMSDEDWKRLFLAGACGQKIVPNPIGEGFIVMNTKRIRGIEKATLAEVITAMLAFGNERGVEWSDPEWQSYLAEMKREAA